MIEVDAVVAPGPGVEARARNARYKAIREGAGPGSLLVTAHHRNDQAETVLLRLLRGAGPVGLRGIHPLRADGVWRPFLSVPRSTLAAMCEEHGWTPRQDSSNLDITFARNSLRHEIIPSLEQDWPGITDHLVALAHAAQLLEPHLARAQTRLADAIGLVVDHRGFACDLSNMHDPASDPELELLLEHTWTKIGRRPWANQQRKRLLCDVASQSTGRRCGGQGELAIWGAGRLRIERA